MMFNFLKLFKNIFNGPIKFAVLLIFIGVVYSPKKKLQKSVKIWDNLTKRYYFWTIIKQKRKKV